MTSFHAIKLLVDTHRWILRHRMHEMLPQIRPLVLTIGGFLGLYCVASYLQVARGLDFIIKKPLFGLLLTERLVHVSFFSSLSFWSAPMPRSLSWACFEERIWNGRWRC